MSPRGRGREGSAMDIRREERAVRGGKGENTTGERSESSRKGTNRRDDLSAVRARDILYVIYRVRERSVRVCIGRIVIEHMDARAH